jgi:tRNA nucleotidyltransferase/poly(A) polymerase
MVKSYQQFLAEQDSNKPGGVDKDWRKHFIQLPQGFVPPSKMRPIIEAFLKSGDITLSNDTTKAPTMPKKSLFLVGGPVRDFILGKSIKDYDLATNATPEQTAHILANAGFKMSPERSGKDGKPLNINFKPEVAQQGDRKTWFIKGRDASDERKVFVISAVVDGEEFEIATFRRDAKVTDGAAAVDFVDNPHDDANRRDLTINSMYIELTKADGENTKLYDPTGKGYHDAKNKQVRTVGKAEERFNEDKLRVMRAVRFHCRFGGGAQLDPDIEQALPKFKSLSGVALERIRDEFLKGLLHPEVDTRCYLNIYKRTGLLNTVFPGLVFDPPNGMPAEFTDKKDKPLALAWLLQHNPVAKVNEVLSGTRRDGMEDRPTGWASHEKNAIIFLLKLKEFNANNPEHLTQFMRMQSGTGLTPEQIRDWVEMFKIKNTNRDRRPWWAKQVRAYADHKPSVRWDDIEKQGQDICPQCRGVGCDFCGGDGKLPKHMRGSKIGELENVKFQQRLQAKTK